MEEQVMLPFGAPFPPEVQAIVEAAPRVIYADSTEELFSLSVRDARDGWHEVAYETPGKGRVVERVSAGRATALWPITRSPTCGGGIPILS